MDRIIIFFLLNVFLINVTNAHPWKPDHYVIIETDCGLDDFRAINLMLNSSNIRVLAIVASNGVVSAENGYRKVKCLLNDYAHNGLLVGMNNNPNQKSFDCKAAVDFKWGVEGTDSSGILISYEEVLNKVFEHTSDKISYVNLGGLNSISSYFRKYPDKIDRVKEFVWTCNYEARSNAFNYLLDTVSYHSLVKKGIEIRYVNADSFGDYTQELEQEINNTKTDLAKNIVKSLMEPQVPFAKKMFDESAVFYLLEKELFDYSSNLSFELKSGIDINKEYMHLIQPELGNDNQTFSKFPLDTAYYITDIQKIMEPTLDKFGVDEWIACILTSELHRHLGVYSLIGAKMGVLAREYFGAGIDELKVHSYAGLTPPFSCLNDGLQVSTGATLGHGLISTDANNKIPKADFYYLGQKITISLKKEYREKIRTEIKDLRVIYGLDSNVYWDLVRDLAIKYWSNWSRYDIFEIEIE